MQITQNIRERSYQSALRFLPEVFREVQSIYLVFYRDTEREIIGWKSDCKYPFDFEEIAVETEIINRRKEKSSYKWLNTYPEATLRPSGQLEVFDELKYNVLRIGLQNPFDQLTDHFYLLFPSDQPGPSLNKVARDTDSKHITGEFAFRFLSAHIQGIQDHLMEIAEMNEISRMVIKENLDLKRKLNQSGKTSGRFVKLYLDKLLEVTKGNRNLEIELSEEAIDRIENFKGSPEVIEEVLKRGLKYALAIQSEENYKIILEAVFLNFPSENEYTAEPEETNDIILHNTGRYKKTIMLLDKLEKAFLEVNRRGLIATSAHVGEACPTPISAAAISDSLKKHRTRIEYLLKKYPFHWQGIRNHFKPLHNILDRVYEEKTTMKIPENKAG